MDHRSRNQALVRFILLPTIFLLVVLLGGLRVGAETHALMFLPPPLITLVLALLLMLLFIRGHLLKPDDWLSGDQPVLRNISHALTLLALFFASAQSFNSVLPEGGLLHWLFSLFFLWTLWNNQFIRFDARGALRSLTVLFGTAFALKHLLLAALYEPEGGWLRRLGGVLLEGVSLGTIQTESFAPATGYISFFTLVLYVTGLILCSPAHAPRRDEDLERLLPLQAERGLSPPERLAAREAIQAGPAIENEANAVDELEEETVITIKPKTSGGAS